MRVGTAIFVCSLLHDGFQVVSAADMVVITSTNGTPATAARNKSGRSFSTAPTKRPPADRPSVDVKWGLDHPPACSASAQLTKSLNVLRFARYLP
jgi:hypothetical protein